MPDSDEPPDLTRFVKLAKAGLSAADDSMEWSVYLLAKTVSQEAPNLDDSTLRGLCHFIGIAKVSPDRARQLLEGRP